MNPFEITPEQRAAVDRLNASVRASFVRHEMEEPNAEIEEGLSLRERMLRVLVVGPTSSVDAANATGLSVKVCSAVLSNLANAGLIQKVGELRPYNGIGPNSIIWKLCK